MNIIYALMFCANSAYGGDECSFAKPAAGPAQCEAELMSLNRGASFSGRNRYYYRCMKMTVPAWQTVGDR